LEAGVLEVVGCGLVALGRDVFTAECRVFTVRRRAVIGAHADLRGRDAVKGVDLTAAVGAALVERGAEVVVADVVAQLGALALKRACEQWCDLANAEEFADVARSLGEVRAAVSAV
jgi:hypothetical protein